MAERTPLSKNFFYDEFECPCCGMAPIDADFIFRLQRLRTALRMPLRVTSGYRCAKHNKDVGGSPRSLHMRGRAADLMRPATTQKLYRVIQMAMHYGFQGIGIYEKHIHLDDRKPPDPNTVPAFWRL